MAASGLVMVEFYGIPRERAGVRELTVPGNTILEALKAVEQVCPRLGSLVDGDGRLSPHLLLSVNGERFITNAAQPLAAGESLLLFSADLGG